MGPATLAYSEQLPSINYDARAYWVETRGRVDWFLRSRSDYNFPTMNARYLTADVFTDRRFGGNQLAVFPDASGIASDLMPQIAREFNYSETTFVLRPADPSNTARVRIFTPGGELAFAGHPTVGTAHVLASIGAIQLTGAETRIVFEEGAGPVPV